MEEEPKSIADPNNWLCEYANAEGTLVGRVTVDDIMDFSQTEATKDIYEMAAILSEALENSPLLFRRLGFDPAVASGPLITTLNDVVSLFLYFGIAVALLKKWVGKARQAVVSKHYQEDGYE